MYSTPYGYNFQHRRAMAEHRAVLPRTDVMPHMAEVEHRHGDFKIVAMLNNPEQIRALAMDSPTLKYPGILALVEIMSRAYWINVNGTWHRNALQ